MLNFYPWGLSVNLVQPKSINSTNVSFRSYIYDKNKLNYGAGSDLDKVEHEDEEVVENVNKGLKSSFIKQEDFHLQKKKVFIIFIYYYQNSLINKKTPVNQ